MTEPRDFVLIHGAWCGGWIWRRVADRLRARGHRVFTPTLTGLADRSHLASAHITLSTHILDVANLIRWEELTDVVLAAHSYAGMVVSGVAEIAAPGAVAAVVYLDAALPENGKSLADYAPLPPRMADAEHLVAPVPAAPPRMNAADAPWLNRMRTPQPVGTFTEPAKLTGALERIPLKTYVLARGYDGGSLKAFAARAKADPTWRYEELPCGHDMMLAMPDETADLLERAAVG
jgi:pimeloyl-ACP methyl ester carboxylesterase